jgi:hypothetical protein
MNTASGKTELRTLVLREASDGRVFGQIRSGEGTDGACQAVCRSKRMEKNGPLPVAMDLECRSASLGSLSSTATLLWGRGRSMSKMPTLRFGTWLHGFEQVPLKVEVDQFSVPGRQLANRAPAVLPSKARSMAAR